MSDDPPAPDHRQLARTLFNDVWTLLDNDARTTADDDRMLHCAHASRYHWGEVGDPVALVRGEWQCSRVYATLGRSEPAMHHANRALELATEQALTDWDLAFCHEALARAHAVAEDPVGARACATNALAVAIADPEDRELLLGDLESIPGLERFW